MSTTAIDVGSSIFRPSFIKLWKRFKLSSFFGKANHFQVVRVLEHLGAYCNFPSLGRLFSDLY